MDHFGGRMGVIWPFWCILPCSSCTGRQAESFEYLHDTFCRSSKMGHFGTKGVFWVGGNGRIFSHFSQLCLVLHLQDASCVI